MDSWPCSAWHLGRYQLIRRSRFDDGGEPPAEFVRQSRFADAGRADQRDDTVIADQIGQAGQFRLAPDQRNVAALQLDDARHHGGTGRFRVLARQDDDRGDVLVAKIVEGDDAALISGR